MANLIVVAYDTELQAEEVRLKLLKLQKDYLLDLEDAVVMAEAEAAVMLVSTHSESRKAENIVGVVTLATVAQLLEQAEGIS